jgi:peptidoglycan L-alanyl-D-glutamate endopeptidase CwlK
MINGASMANFILGKRSTDNLIGVHPDLVRVVKRALELSPVDFTVIEGLRTKERQAELLKQGFTRTMNSRHIIGQAVDIVPLPVDWNNPKPFGLVAEAMKKAADELGVKITWGGDFKTFVDLPHYQIEVKK